MYASRYAATRLPRSCAIACRTDFAIFGNVPIHSPYPSRVATRATRASTGMTGWPPANNNIRYAAPSPLIRGSPFMRFNAADTDPLSAAGSSGSRRNSSTPFRSASSRYLPNGPARSTASASDLGDAFHIPSIVRAPIRFSELTAAPHFFGVEWPDSTSQTNSVNASDGGAGSAPQDFFSLPTTLSMRVTSDLDRTGNRS